MQLIEPVYPNKPVLGGVSLFQVSQINRAASNDSVTGTVVPSRITEIQLMEQTIFFQISFSFLPLLKKKN